MFNILKKSLIVISTIGLIIGFIGFLTPFNSEAGSYTRISKGYPTHTVLCGFWNTSTCKIYCLKNLFNAHPYGVCERKTQNAIDRFCQNKWFLKEYSKTWFWSPLTGYVDLKSNTYHSVPRYTNPHTWGHMEKDICVVNDGHPY
jgi:hypothetical protein